MDDEEIEKSLKIGFFIFLFLSYLFILETKEMKRKLDQVLTEDGEDIGEPLIKKMRVEKEGKEEEEGDEEEDFSPLSNISINDQKRLEWSKNLVSTLISQLSSQSSSSSSSTEDVSTSQAFSRTIHSLQSKLLHMRSMVLDAYSEVGRLTKENAILQKQLKAQIREEFGDSSSTSHSHEEEEETKKKDDTKTSSSSSSSSSSSQEETDLMIEEEEKINLKDELRDLDEEEFTPRQKLIFKFIKKEKSGKIRSLENKVKQLEEDLKQSEEDKNAFQSQMEDHQAKIFKHLDDKFEEAMENFKMNGEMEEDQEESVDEKYQGHLKDFNKKTNEVIHQYEDKLSQLLSVRETECSALNSLNEKVNKLYESLAKMENIGGEEDIKNAIEENKLAMGAVFEEVESVMTSSNDVEEKCDELLEEVSQYGTKITEANASNLALSNELDRMSELHSEQLKLNEELTSKQEMSFEKVRNEINNKASEYHGYLTQFSYLGESQSFTEEQLLDTETQLSEV